MFHQNCCKNQHENSSLTATPITWTNTILIFMRANKLYFPFNYLVWRISRRTYEEHCIKKKQKEHCKSIKKLLRFMKCITEHSPCYWNSLGDFRCHGISLLWGEYKKYLFHMCFLHACLRFSLRQRKAFKVDQDENVIESFHFRRLRLSRAFLSVSHRSWPAKGSRKKRWAVWELLLLQHGPI